MNSSSIYPKFKNAKRNSANYIVRRLFHKEMICGEKILHG